MPKLRTTVGLVEWFHFRDYEGVISVLDVLRQLGVRHLRTAVSWADFVRPDGREWYDWLFANLSRAGVEALPNFLYTPPSRGRIPYSSSPPVNLKDYADFVDVAITRYGESFEYVELWNEPTNWAEWDRGCDPEWRLLAEMLSMAAHWARQRGKKTVLGGLIPVNIPFLVRMERFGALQHFDVVGIHGFPGTWEGRGGPPEEPWRGWTEELALARRTLRRLGRRPDIWVTEAGSSTAAQPAESQVARFCEAYSLDVDRLYWYGVRDLDCSRATINHTNLGETPAQNPHHYHLGFRGKALHDFLLANKHIFAGM